MLEKANIIVVMIKRDGIKLPKAAARAPKMPLVVYPINIETFKAIAPGKPSATEIISANFFFSIIWCLSMTSLSTRGIME